MGTSVGTSGWQELVRHPASSDHLAQLYQDEDFLAEAASEFIGTGLRRGEAALVIATAAHRALLLEALECQGLYPAAAIARGQLRLLDAGETLEALLVHGAPDYRRFEELLGSEIGALRLQFPTVRAYGEMVDLLWGAGRLEAVSHLEACWNQLAARHTFTLLCTYRLDNLDAEAYGGPLEALCAAHTHLIPARDYARFDEAVREASKAVLDQPLAQMLLALSARDRPATQMPLGQTTLLWLARHMPRTADRILSQVRARCTPR